MTASVAIVDYGAGNLRSASKAFERAVRTLDAQIDVTVTSEPELVRRADRIVLPGVGAFADCMAGLLAIKGMRDVLEERVVKAGVPFLGICVGMQLMATEGREKGVHPGLGWIEGAVVRLEPQGGLRCRTWAGTR
jgi:glutamine amidotransferase